MSEGESNGKTFIIVLPHFNYFPHKKTAASHLPVKRCLRLFLVICQATQTAICPSSNIGSTDLYIFF